MEGTISRFYRYASVFALFLIPLAACPAIRHVPASYPTIQAAVDAAGDGDTIRIADGVYSGQGNIDIQWDASLKHLVIMSENGHENCIIDCMQEGRAFLLNQGQDRRDVIDGLTMIRGMVYGPGGAILMSSVSPIIRNCLLTGNHATGYHDNSFSGGGGALMIYKESNPLILHNIIQDNIADNLGGGILFAEHTQGEVRANVIEGNKALDDWGGGIALWNSPSPLISNNLIIKNSCSGFDGGRGGGIYLGHSSSWLVNNTIAYNSTTGNEYGDGLGGGISILYGAPVIRNCIIWGNRSGEYYMNIDFDLQEWMDISYSNVEDDLGHIFDLEPHTNMDSLPGFVDPENGDFQLLWNSPCINTGTTDTTGLYLPSLDLAGNDRIFEGRIDIGAYEYNRPAGKASRVEEAYFSVYPNPAKGVIYLECGEDQKHDDLVVQLCNSGGALVYVAEFNAAKTVIPIDISAYPEGIYFLRVYSRRQVLFRDKVVKH